MEASPMKIPDETVKYILLQRTGYTRIQRNFLVKFFRKLLPEEYRHTRLVDLEVFLRKEAIKREYRKDMESEFRDIEKHLPAKADAVLDIGCGVGGINILLHRHYGSPNTAFYCLDKTQLDDIYYGYKEKAAFYNSLEATREFLSANGIRNLYMLTANDGSTIETPETFDLIFSLISWGFHYPIETYLDQAYDRLRTGGRLILDVRRNTSGLDTIRRTFGTVETISETEKKIRVLAVKS